MAQILKALALLLVGFIAGALLWPDSISEQRVGVSAAFVSGDNIDLLVGSCDGNPRALVWNAEWDQKGPVEIEVVAFVRRWGGDDCGDILSLPFEGTPPAQLLDKSSGEIINVENR
jgi:hypothetical protein